MVNHPRRGEPVSFEAFAAGQAQQSEILVVMSLEYVRTRPGAERIYRAECAGRKRPAVLARAIRRLDEFDRRHVPHGGSSGAATIHEGE
jgi:hypothetical protein